MVIGFVFRINFFRANEWLKDFRLKIEVLKVEAGAGFVFEINFFRETNG